VAVAWVAVAWVAVAWVAVAWVEVAEVADLKRKEYRNDIRQLAPLRKPIEDCGEARFLCGKRRRMSD